MDEVVPVTTEATPEALAAAAAGASLKTESADEVSAGERLNALINMVSSALLTYLYVRASGRGRRGHGIIVQHSVLILVIEFEYLSYLCLICHFWCQRVIPWLYPWT